MWINNGIIEKLIDDSKSIPEGFVKGRKPKPKKIDSLKRIVSKEMLMNYYIVENHSYTDTLAHFNLATRKDLRLLLNLYGIAKDHKKSAKYAKRSRTHESYVEGGKKSSATQKKNWSEKSESEKQAWSEMQKIAHSTDHFKTTLSQKLREYNQALDEETRVERNIRRAESCRKAWENPKLVQTQKATAKANRVLRKQRGEMCRTEDEQRIYEYLCSLYDDVRYDVFVDERYPYYVDFYLPQIDVFIEYQGYPAHGRIPFSPNDSEAIEQARVFYGSWRDTYIRRDVEKQEKASHSGICLLRIYPNATLDENYSINNNMLKELIEGVYHTIK